MSGRKKSRTGKPTSATGALTIGGKRTHDEQVRGYDVPSSCPGFPDAENEHNKAPQWMQPPSKGSTVQELLEVVIWRFLFNPDVTIPAVVRDHHKAFAHFKSLFQANAGDQPSTAFWKALESSLNYMYGDERYRSMFGNRSLAKLHEIVERHFAKEWRLYRAELATLNEMPAPSPDQRYQGQMPVNILSDVPNINVQPWSLDKFKEWGIIGEVEATLVSHNSTSPITPAQPPPHHLPTFRELCNTFYLPTELEEIREDSDISEVVPKMVSHGSMSPINPTQPPSNHLLPTYRELYNAFYQPTNLGEFLEDSNINEVVPKMISHDSISPGTPYQPPPHHLSTYRGPCNAFYLPSNFEPPKTGEPPTPFEIVGNHEINMGADGNRGAQDHDAWQREGQAWMTWMKAPMDEFGIVEDFGGRTCLGDLDPEWLDDPAEGEGLDGFAVDEDAVVEDDNWASLPFTSATHVITM